MMFEPDTCLVHSAWEQVLKFGCSEKQPVISKQARSLGYDLATVAWFTHDVVEVWFFKPNHTAIGGDDP